MKLRKYNGLILLSLVLLSIFCLPELIRNSVWVAAEANVALNKTATASGFSSPYTPERAVDGSITPTSRWYSGTGAGAKWLSVDLGEMYRLNRWVVKGMGSVSGWDAARNPADLKLQASVDNSSWFDVDVAGNNTASVIDRTVNPFTARYVRVYITKGNQWNNIWTSIMEFEVYDCLLLDNVKINLEDGSITGTTSAMQYSLNSSNGTDGTWFDCSDGNTAVTFIPGKVYVREKSQVKNYYLVDTLDDPVKRVANFGTTSINKSYSVFYFETQVHNLTVTTNVQGEIKFNGQTLKSFTDSTEVVPLSLLEGKNDLEVSFRDGNSFVTRKVAVFYVPPGTSSGFRGAVMAQVIEADAASIDENSFFQGVNSILSKNTLRLSELNSEVQKSYALLYSEKDRVNLNYCMINGNISVSVNGGSAGTSGALEGNILLQLNRGCNEVLIQCTTAGSKNYKISIFYFPTSIKQSVRQTISNAIIAADPQVLDETTYQREVANILEVVKNAESRKLVVNDIPIPSDCFFNILYTESQQIIANISSYGPAKVSQDSSLINSFSGEHQDLPINLHNGVNNLEIQIGEGTSLKTYKVCVFYLPAEAEASLRANVSREVDSTRQRNFNQTSYNNEIKRIIQSNKYIAFTNFVGNLDMKRQYRILYTEESYLSVQLSNLEAGEVTVLKMSDSSGVGVPESYLVNATTGRNNIQLVEGRNELKFTFTEFGEQTTYYIAVIKGSSQFGRMTKDNIINSVIKADEALRISSINDTISTQYKVYQNNLTEVTNNYFQNLNSNWFRWL